MKLLRPLEHKPIPLTITLSHLPPGAGRLSDPFTLRLAEVYLKLDGRVVHCLINDGLVSLYYVLAGKNARDAAWNLPETPTGDPPRHFGNLRAPGTEVHCPNLEYLNHSPLLRAQIGIINHSGTPLPRGELSIVAWAPATVIS